VQDSKFGSSRHVPFISNVFKAHYFYSTQALETFAQRTFSIQGSPPSLLRFRTTCNLGCAPVDCDSVFEVSEEAWEEEGLRELVGCLEVSLCKDEDGKVIPGPVENPDEPPSRAESPQLSYVDGESGAELSQHEHEPEDADVDERVRVSDERQELKGEISNAENHDAGAAPEEIRAREILDGEKDSTSDINSETKEEQIALRARPSGRARRRVIASDEEDGETSDRNLATDPRPSASIAGAHPVDPLQTSGELPPSVENVAVTFIDIQIRNGYLRRRRKDLLQIEIVTIGRQLLEALLRVEHVPEHLNQ
jgi:hypothetical protein